MANPEHVKYLKQGVKTWNIWREQNPNKKPDLSKADLRKSDLSAANLSMVNLCEADLSDSCLDRVNFRKANLNKANMTGSSLEDAKFDEANISESNLSGTFLLKASFWKSDLREADLTGAHMHESYLWWANLCEAKLCNAKISRAILGRADLTGANLSGAGIVETNFTDSDFTGANLTNANLERNLFVEATFNGADLSNSYVYGISAWNLKTNKFTKQLNLVITKEDEPKVTVDDIEVAQFVYLMLNNEKIRNILTTIGEKGVLILGRFKPPERKLVLDALRERLRDLNYVPMMFDFEKADDRSFTETIKILAGLSRFVIADVTNPKSAPLELQAAVPDYMVPFIPIIQQGEEPFSMLEDLQQYEWVMALKEYRSIDQLLEKLESKIIEPALKLHAELQLKKARGIQRESLDD